MPKAIMSREPVSQMTTSNDTGHSQLVPGSSNATPVRQDARTPDWALLDVQEFVPRRGQESQMVSSLPAITLRGDESTVWFLSNLYLLLQTNESDIPVAQPFETFQSSHAANPYLDPGMNGAAFYQNATGFHQPVSAARTMDALSLMDQGTIPSVCSNRALQHKPYGLSTHRPRSLHPK